MNRPYAMKIVCVLLVTILFGFKSMCANTFFVNDTTDTTNINSLRGAIIAANANGGVNVIILTNAVYPLTLSGVDENGSYTGDLNITNGSLIIIGASDLSVIIDATNLGDRVFQVCSNAQLTLVDLTITGGYSPISESGGSIYNIGTLTLENCIISNNVSSLDGGGIYNSGVASLTHCIVTDNVSTDGAEGTSGGDGGGIYNFNACVLTDCIIKDNLSGSGGVGAYFSGDGGNGGNGAGFYNAGVLTADNCTIETNTCGSGGNSGYALGNGGNGGNGGIYNAGDLTIQNCILQNNYCGVGGIGSINGGPSGIGGCGGGIYNTGTVTMASCTISNNFSGKGGQGYTYNSGADGGSGGGIYNTRSLTISKSIISGNFGGKGGDGSFSGGSGGNGGDGGGIFNTGESSLAECSILYNLSGGAGFGNISANGGDGGGIWNSGSLTFYRSTLAHNFGGIGATAYLVTLGSGTGGKGGGAYNAGCLVLSDSTVGDNFAGQGGNGASGEMDYGFNSMGSGGTGGSGGGIYNEQILRVVSCSFSANVGGNGGAGGNSGGIHPNGGSGGLGGNGGGIFNDSNSTVFLWNTLVAGNLTGTGGTGGNGSTEAINGSTGVSGSGSDLFGTFDSQGYNLISQSDGLVGLTNGINGDLTGNIENPLNPHLTPLQLNGGVTQTYALLPGSPAIDAGDDMLIDPPTNLTMDQRESPRKSGAHVDIGAFEYDGTLNGIVLPPLLTRSEITCVGMKFWFNAASGTNYSVWASTNLSTWTKIGAASENSHGWFLGQDTDALNFDHRFYQVRQP